MVEPISDQRLAIWRRAAVPFHRVDMPHNEFAALLARLDAAEAERDRLRAEVERLKTPDMFWADSDGYARDDWTEVLDTAAPLEIIELRSALDLGERFVVWIPQSDPGAGYSREDCHLFGTHEEAEAAVAKAKGVQDV